jgi:protein-tyrosine-phosphatase
MSERSTAPEIYPSVLFVCTANRIRSPLAAGLFRALLLKQGLPLKSWRIETAGTWAQEDLPVFPEVVAIMAQKGIDLQRHRSRRIDEKMLRSHRLILVMEAGQKEALQHVYPDLAERVYLLSEMAGSIDDIQDPAGMRYQDFEATANLIENVLQIGLPRIILLAHDSH